LVEWADGVQLAGSAPLMESLDEMIARNVLELFHAFNVEEDVHCTPGVA
jgi:hypothetical protein